MTDLIFFVNEKKNSIFLKVHLPSGSLNSLANALCVGDAAEPRKFGSPAIIVGWL